MTQFDRRWTRPAKEPFASRVKEAIRSSGPLKQKLVETQRAIEAQVAKLDAKVGRLREKDTQLFAKAVSAIQRHDPQQASVFANELGEVRKMQRIVTQSKMVLEQIHLRLSTVFEIGDLLVTLTPAASIIRSVKGSLAGIIPEADHDLGEIGGMLSSIIADAGQLGGSHLSFEPGSEDAEKILAEASVIAEQRAKERLPEIPGSAAGEDSALPGLPDAS